MGASFCSTMATVSMKSRWAVSKSEFPFSKVCPFLVVEVHKRGRGKGERGKEDGKEGFKEEGKEKAESFETGAIFS